MGTASSVSKPKGKGQTASNPPVGGSVGGSAGDPFGESETLQIERILKARIQAAETMDLMARFDIPPTPEHFAVWHAYVSGDIETLKSTIDAAIEGERGSDEVRSGQWFEQFILPTYRTRAIEEVANGLEGAAGDLAQSIDRAGAGASKFGAALSNASDQFDRPGSADPTATIAVLRRETEAARQTNETLKAELADRTGELAALRRKLEGAREEALTDGLTGIANRKRFDAMLREAVTEALTEGRPMSLLMLDIDHFKRFNDTHGHSVGDQVLRLLGRTLTESVRETDIPARYGGEEFSVILPATEADTARVIAERIRKRLAKKRITRRNTKEDLGVVTVSIGVAPYLFGEPVTNWINRADKALYAAKDAGRNRVMIADG